MRLLLVISDLAFHGAQKQVVELSKGLAARGHEVCIYTLNSDAPRARELDGSGVELVVDQKRSKLDWAVVSRLRAKVRQMRADIVHGFLYDGDLYARLAGFGTGARVLNSERSADYELSRGQRLGHKLTHFLVDGVVANSKYGARFAEKTYGYDPERMHVVWNGMRIEELERKAESKHDYRAEFFGEGDYKVACMVGHIKPAKDYPLALDTAAALVNLDPAWRVLFIGDSLSHAAYKPGQDSDTSDYKRAAMEQYQRLAIADRVRFAGARSDCPAILAQCDVQFHTSRWEGFPNAVLEGMALGVPVVSTEYSDIRDILPRATQVVASRKPGDLARAIIAAYEDREALASEQKRWVRAHASIENATRELERVYSIYVRKGACVRAA